MDIRLLETFRAVIETQSMTGAAKLLGLTQPAISTQISRLEAQIGFPLFERVNGRLKASRQGRLFYAEVRHALGMIERLTRDAESIRKGVTESVTIASHPSASTAILPTVVAELRRGRPLAHVRMINRSSEEVRAIFEAGGTDIAIAEWPIHIPDIDLRRYRVPCVAIMPAGHALAARQEITPADLAGQPLVGMQISRLIGHQIQSAFVEHDVEYDPGVVNEYFSSICALVATGAGIGIVDQWSAQMFEPLGLAIRPFRPTIMYEIGVFVRSQAKSIPIVHEVLGLIGKRLAALELKTTDHKGS